MKDEVKPVVRRRAYIPDNTTPPTTYTSDSAPAGRTPVKRQAVADRGVPVSDFVPNVAPMARRTAAGKSAFNLQDQFLNEARKNETIVKIKKLDGETIIGKVKSFDCFCILFACAGEPGGDMLIYKHTLESIAALP